MKYLYYSTTELQHHDIKGQKWGVRRYQNKDGTLTNAGVKRRAQLESQARKYDDESTIYSERSSRQQKELSDINKNGKKSKYYNNYLAEIDNPGTKHELKEVKQAVKQNIKYNTSKARESQEIANHIRNTELGKKSIEEIAKRKEMISKGASYATLAGSIVAAKLLYDKGGLVNKGAAAAVAMLGVQASVITRMTTTSNAAIELAKEKRKENG